MRFDVTVTDVKPVEDDLMAVYLTLKSTGIAIYDRPMEQASITYPGEKATPLDTEAKRQCSNGLDGIVRIDVCAAARGACCSRGPATRCPSASSSRSRSSRPWPAAFGTCADRCNFCQMTAR